MNLRETIEGWGLKHFSVEEITFLGGKNEQLGTNSLPPPELWHRMRETALIADFARSYLGVPLRVLSGYRNAVYNAGVGGSANSLHLKFNALDLACEDPKRLFQLLRSWRNVGVFNGGLGLYRRSGFVHLDTRGYPATWGDA